MSVHPRKQSSIWMRFPRGMLPSWLGSLWLLLVLAFSAGALAQPVSPSAGGPVPVASTTQGVATPTAPGDAPRLGDGALSLPPTPTGFARHSAGWIDYAYPPEARSRLSKLLEVADSTRLELSNKLGAVVLTDVHVRIARTPVEMMTLAPENAPYPKYAAGVAYPDLGLILITLAPEHPGQNIDIIETFKHELGHLALHDAVKGKHVPRWFNEGFAVFVSGESSLPRLQTLWVATVSGNLIPLERLEKGFPEDANDASVAYAEAADVVRYLVRHQDRYRFDGLVERLARGMSFDESLRLAYNIDRATLEAEWREDVAKRYTYWPILSSTGLLWIGILGLFFLGYRRRTLRNQKTLERWRREEAREDAREAARAETRRLVFENALHEASREAEPRVHIIVAPPAPPVHNKSLASSDPDVEVPKVEHEGSVYTLH